ncbi:MAG TPA: Holliday junction branch migration DNA helicase RuvB [Candidatus Saccharimonadia bacterium]|nr:Holliday junction branch migration DNA helicase RuvB [Candidatus Saccharimonadia bacterium]
MLKNPQRTQTLPVQTAAPEDEILFTSLRAATWEDFHGQEEVKRALQIAISAAKKRKEAVDHVLLYGPPGLGKTTLSHLIAKEMNSNIKVTSGTALSKVGDLAAILTNLEPNDILFVDEIHRLPKAVEETLYPAMEDYALDIVIGKGPSARTIRLDLPHFTLVGATTRLGLLTGPFRDRFGVIHKLEYYQPDRLRVIVELGAKKLDIKIDNESALAIAKRARGTPRIALKLLKRVRDFAQVEGDGEIAIDTVIKALDMLRIDELGLQDSDRQMIRMIIEKYGGGPVGVSTIATSLHEDPGTIEEVYEPYLIEIGFMKRTPQGRVLTKHAYKHLGVPYIM